jgi:hypothetical protein
VFENRVLRRIFGRDEVTGGWRKLHKEDVMGKAYNMHVTDDKCFFLLEILKGRNHLEDLEAEGRVILKWVSRKQCMEGGVWTGFISLAQINSNSDFAFE